MKGNEFKDIFKYLRVKNGLSQSQLAKKLGVSPALIGMYEQGRRKPSFEMEENIADFFNVDINLLRGIEVPELNEKQKQLLDLISNLDARALEQVIAYAQALNDAFGGK